MRALATILAAATLVARAGTARGAQEPFATAPEPPRAHIEIVMEPPSGRTLRVAAGGDLQAALDSARPGDVIVLAAGSVYNGPFRLPRKPSSEGWIVVRTSAPDEQLPPTGRRVSPDDAARMPRLQSSSGSVVEAEPGAHHYRFFGLEMSPTPGTSLTNVAQFGSSASSPADVPHHIILDRCYVHGDSAQGSRRGIALNAAHAAVVGCWISDFKEEGADTQAIGCWSGPGPFRIEGNYLEAAGENIMFGGADPAIRGLTPSDIEIRRNRLTKPLTWKEGSGPAWSVKNLLELKNARRVVIEGNVLENNWAQSQNGFAVLLTPRNQDGSAPWSTVEDVLFSNNVVAQSGSGVNILGHDDAAASGRTQRLAILNNLFLGIDGSRWGGSGTLFQLLGGITDLRIENNTAVHSGAMVMAEGEPHRRFVYRGNLTSRGTYGFIGTGTGPEEPTLRAYFPGAVVEDNQRFAGGRPPDARQPGTRHGADIAALCAALAPEDRPAAGCDSTASLMPRR